MKRLFISYMFPREQGCSSETRPPRRRTFNGKQRPEQKQLTETSSRKVACFTGNRLYTLITGLCFVIALTLVPTSCIREDVYNDDPVGNFEALWKIIDEQYCFLDYKAEKYGLDWNEVHERYRKLITADMTKKGLFEVLGNMLAELRDGHVNLYSTFDVARYWAWHEDYPQNFSDSIQRIYLGTDYKIASSLKYKILDDNIAYVYCESFENGIGNGNLSDMLQDLAICNGLILDVRNNTGGKLTTSTKLAERFTNEKTLVGYICHKTGKGHSDFSSPQAVSLDPANGVRWQKNVVVLTNRSSYSATNDFVNSMNQLPNVTLIGDWTGGGSGLPFSSELPNGWSVRFSASPMFDPQMNHLEFGIEPDIPVNMTSEDIKKGKDTIIECARKHLNDLYSGKAY